MCITKKATKKSIDKPKSKESENGKNKNKKKNPGGNQKKKFRIPTFARKKSDEIEKIDEKLDETQPEVQKESIKEEVKEEEEVKKIEELPIQKEPNRKPIVINKPNCANFAAISSTTKKKTAKYRCGQIDREELSINNDKTEYLENAQLTKLMSHADVKLLMTGQMGQGENGDDACCQDTVEEVDDEMQDIVFSPLLVPIPPEESKACGAIPPRD